MENTCSSSAGTILLWSFRKQKKNRVNSPARQYAGYKLGVISARLEFVTAYSVTHGTEIEYGLLYYADIDDLGPFPHTDLVSVYYLDTPPEDNAKWSFPETQKPLLDKAVEAHKN